MAIQITGHPEEKALKLITRILPGEESERADALFELLSILRYLTEGTNDEHKQKRFADDLLFYAYRHVFMFTKEFEEVIRANSRVSIVDEKEGADEPAN